MTLTLILGGVRSGKTARAEQFFDADDAVRYVATAGSPDGDPDLVARVAAHRDRRPDSWTTVQSQDLGAVLAEGAEPTLIDDLGSWLAARLDAIGWGSTHHALVEIDALVSAAAGYAGRLVLVSPEVGLAVTPDNHGGRVFQDLLGDLNTRLAAVADQVELVIAGRAVSLGAEAAPSSARTAVPVARTADLGGDAAPAAEPAASTPVAAAPPIALPPFEAGTDLLSFPTITPPDAAFAQAARERHRLLAVPAGALGRLESLGTWVAACQGACPPEQFERVRVVVMAGDHGVAEHGVSAYPSTMTAQIVENLVADQATVTTFAGQANATVRVEDISVESDTREDLSRNKIRRASGDISTTDALTDEETIAAIAAGRRIADQEVDGGADLLILGAVGIGQSTPAAALVGALTDTEPVVVIGRGSGIDDNAWMRKASAIRDGMYRARPHVGNPKALLRTVTGADFAAMAGFLAQAAVRRTPVVLDGLAVLAAALVAQDLAPGASSWWVAGPRSSEPGHALALRRLDHTPILNLSVGLSDGSGAALAVPLLRSAVAVLA